MKRIDMVCPHCGCAGELEMKGAEADTPPSRIFSHVGHNPYSGDLHYRCPACEIVLLVDPAMVLEGLINEYPRAANKRMARTHSEAAGEAP